MHCDTASSCDCYCADRVLEQAPFPDSQACHLPCQSLRERLHKKEKQMVSFVVSASCCTLYSVICCGCRLAKIKEWIDARDPNATIIPFSGALELKVLP